MGMVYQRGKVWWIKYYRDGRPMRESAHTEKETVARALLKSREGDVVHGLPIRPQIGRVRFEELTADLVNDYKVNARRSLDVLERRIEKHLSPFFRRRRAVSIGTPDIRRYIAKRQEAGASSAEINRELAALKRAYTLAIQSNKLLVRPHIPMLEEDNVRTGFFELEQFQAVRDRLPEALRPVVTFAYITGWRIQSEVLPLQWRQVDFRAGWVRLEVGTTKNGEGRVFPFTTELRALLEAQHDRTEAVQRTRGMVCPSVFHRSGKAIRNFYTAWRNACRKAGCPGHIPHDFRRTAVRNLVRAGIPERVAMMMTGHKTRSVFERYNIVSENDLLQAAQRLDSFTGTISGTVSPAAASAASLTVRK